MRAERPSAPSGDTWHVGWSAHARYWPPGRPVQYSTSAAATVSPAPAAVVSMARACEYTTECTLKPLTSAPPSSASWPLTVSSATCMSSGKSALVSARLPSVRASSAPISCVWPVDERTRSSARCDLCRLRRRSSSTCTGGSNVSTRLSPASIWPGWSSLVSRVIESMPKSPYGPRNSEPPAATTSSGMRPRSAAVNGTVDAARIVMRTPARARTRHCTLW
mmetsp:Transcript_55234/g.135531  ORF Transcript_55234/g.135531 Transcript_55234/m.135531 type:complete len:221 (-) Transcript_55234:1517-2179(-)